MNRNNTGVWMFAFIGWALLCIVGSASLYHDTYTDPAAIKSTIDHIYVAICVEKGGTPVETIDGRRECIGQVEETPHEDGVSFSTNGGGTLKPSTNDGWTTVELYQTRSNRTPLEIVGGR